MTPELIVALLLIGLLAGVMAGMFGIGGGVVIVPALMLFLGFAQKVATGTSLAALLLPVGILAAREYYLKGLLNVRIALLMAAGLFAGAWLGAGFALGLDDLTLGRLYGVFLVYVFWRFVEPIKWYQEIRSGKAPPPAPAARTDVEWYWLLLLGFIAGILSGMFGIGGGVIIVASLVSLLHFEHKLAIGTSSGTLLLPTGLLAVVEYYNKGELEIAAGALVAVGLLFGALAGARITLSLPPATVKHAYGFFLLLISVRFLFPELFLG